ncbi:MAG: radical SAM protein [Spirochaetia bacterium]|nr:radical SAM protein [Spirochaetia bacterium]
MFDSFGRKIHYLRISLTDRCNLRCRYCMPAEGVAWLPHERIMSLENMAKVAGAAAALGFDKIRLTGGEPLVRKGVPQFVTMLRDIPGLDIIAMTTNGTLLAPLAADLARRGLSSVNISLDTVDPERYAYVTRGGRLDDALCGIRAARDAGLPVKLNVVVDPSRDSRDLDGVRAFADELGCAVQTIRQYRLDQGKLDDFHYDRPPPCARCNRIRLLATGELKPCLHGDAVVPVDLDDPAASIRACVAMKPAHGGAASNHNVSAIGG